MVDTSDSRLDRKSKKISKGIFEANEHLSRALASCERSIDTVNNNIEGKVQEVGIRQYRLSEEQRQLANENEKLESLNQQYSIKETELDEAKKAEDRARSTLREQEDKLEKRRAEQAVTAGVGAGLFVVPVVGWIAGTALLVTSFTVLEDAVKVAKNSVSSAESDVNSCKEWLSSKSNERLDMEKRVTDKKMKILQTELNIADMTAELKLLRKVRDYHVAMQEKLRDTCHFMSKLCGKSAVLAIEAKNMYSLQPLFRPLMEIAEMLTLDEQSKLRARTILSEDMTICGMMESKVKAICDSFQNDLV